MTAIDEPEDSVFPVDTVRDDFDDRLDEFFVPDGPLPSHPEPEPVEGNLPMIDRLQDRRLRARKVRRLVRHIEPWSVLKVALLFNLCMYVVVMVAGVLLWNAAETAGTIEDVEQFFLKIFALEEFQFEGEEIFNAVALGGLVVAVAATGFAVLVAILLNLISDLTGGIRVTVVEEETARPVTTLPRRG